MKAIVLEKYGTPDVLKVKNINSPTPGSGEVLVAIEYVGINYAEILSRKGIYGWAPKCPYIPGMEASGVIEKVGNGVKSSKVGERVIVGTKFGTYAEKIVVPEFQVLKALDNFSMKENAAFLVNYLTAWISLFTMGRLDKDDKVLISAAAGGVGTAAVQLASKTGCIVYGLARSQGKVEFIKRLGADDGFNYGDKFYVDEMKEKIVSVDVVLELVGGDVFKNCLNLLNPFGRMIVAGFSSLDLKKWNPYSWLKTYKDLPKIKIGMLAERSISIMSSHIGHLYENNPELLMNAYKDLSKFVTDNNIKPVIGKVFDFNEMADAHRYIESRKSMGKVLIKI